ncbi:MAG TPA: DNA alkylation repair protein [Aggregatilineaceae bacterium]|nr:DNA alkylation repair protein [Aggregatilineaceae bacterium]
MNVTDILDHLKSLSNPDAVAGMARYGINPQFAYGISIPTLRALAKEIGRDHALAEQLWDSGTHEARILASMIDDPKQVTEAQMDRWVEDFNSWDLCDQCLGHLFDRQGKLAHRKALEWSARQEEYVKRAGFVLMARLAVGNKGMADADFEPFWPIMIREATDERNYVKKAINWALRQIGKRSLPLNARAIATAREMQQLDSKAARWIASDALRELASEAVQARLRERATP